MFFIFLFRFLRGYVKFEGKNGFTERFINLCCQSGIPLWSLESVSGGFTACTTVKGYKKIRTAAKKSGVKVRLAGKSGVPFFIHKYRRRSGLLVGTAFFILITSFLSTKIWFVQVEGNENVSDREIISAFEEMGVTVGKSKSEIKPTILQMEAYNRFSQFSWLAVNLEGSTATIEVREKVKVPEMLEEDKPCNIRAAHSGQVTSVKVYEGKGEVVAGSAVAAGDLLINGITENADGTPVLRRARGEITAKTEHKITASCNVNFDCMRKNGKKGTSLWIYFFGYKIPIFAQKPPQGDFETEISEKYFYIGKTKIPVGIIKKTDAGVEKVTVTLTKEEAELYAAREFNEKYQALSASAEIKSEEITPTWDGKTASFSGKFACEENIAREEAIEVEFGSLPE